VAEVVTTPAVGTLSGIRVPIVSAGGRVYTPQLVDYGHCLLLRIENPDMREVITLAVDKDPHLARFGGFVHAYALAAELVRVQDEILKRWSISQLFFGGAGGVDQVVEATAILTA
jgi:hypothetical protein